MTKRVMFLYFLTSALILGEFSRIIKPIGLVPLNVNLVRWRGSEVDNKQIVHTLNHEFCFRHNYRPMPILL